MEQIALQHIVWQEGKHYVAQCLNVDVSSFGDNREDALSNLKEALELFFEDVSPDQIQTVNDPEIVTTSLQRA